ncbi:hypothetical protein Misp02_17760 [Microtetraspora sp. NBRC 16547]|nr:hypothetical protein Misp02_17760 [Microtetraspora sp. NBRC 16547]
MPGEHQRAAVGQLRAQLGRGAEAVQAGHVDVEHGDVRPVPERGGQHGVARADGVHHRQIALQLQQRDERSAYHVLIFGQQNLDHGNMSISVRLMMSSWSTRDRLSGPRFPGSAG